jgi:hypothetical protein
MWLRQSVEVGFWRMSDMNINEVGGLHGPTPRLPSKRDGGGIPPSGRGADPGDRFEPSPNLVKILTIREEIKEGRFETPERVEGTVDAMIKKLRPSFGSHRQGG